LLIGPAKTYKYYTTYLFSLFYIKGETFSVWVV
jgi:hypothetical protein